MHVKPGRKAVAQPNKCVATHELAYVSFKEPEPAQSVDLRQLARLATHEWKRPRGPKDNLAGVHVLRLPGDGLAQQCGEVWHKWVQWQRCLGTALFGSRAWHGCTRTHAHTRRKSVANSRGANTTRVSGDCATRMTASLFPQSPFPVSQKLLRRVRQASGKPPSPASRSALVEPPTHPIPPKTRVTMAAAVDTGGSDGAYAELDDDEALEAYAAESKPLLESKSSTGLICPLLPPSPRHQDSIDGFDDYGNLVQPGSGPPSSGSTHRKRKLGVLPANTPEPWANDTETLPQQPYSFIGMAAIQVNRVYSALTLPQSVDEVDSETIACVLLQLNMRSSRKKAPLAMATSPQTRLFQDGYSAARELTVLRGECDLTALKRAEQRELQNAALCVPSPDGTLSPRPMAITVLCIGPSPSLTPNLKLLLDAAAHIASEPGVGGDQDGIRAASQVRISFLFGNAAKEYARSRSAFCITTKCEGLRCPCNEICITWTEASPMDDVDEVGGYTTNLRSRMRSEFLALRHRASTKEYVEELLGAVTKIWCDSGVVPGPLRLLASYAACASPVYAYAKHRIACARDFCDKLEPHHEAELSDFVTKDARYSGALEWSNLWAKIAPRESPLDGPNVSHGLLLHQEGCRDEAREYIRRVRDEESQRNVKGCFGLRGPVDTTEMATCMHVLLANADTLYIDTQFSCFGLRSVAGESFGSVLPCLNWRLLPLTEALKETVFVLPCHEELIYNAQQETNQSLRDTTQRAIEAYEPLLLKGGVANAARTRLPSPPPAQARAPTPQEAMLTMLLGLPLTCKAFRIGDVANALQSASAESSQQVPIPSGLSCFFLSAAQALGTEESVNNAFGWASTNADSVMQMTSQMEALTNRVKELEIELKVARAMPPTSASSSAPTPPNPPNPPRPPEVPQAAAVTVDSKPVPETLGVELNADRRGRLLESWGRTSDFSDALCYTLKEPIQGKSLRMVLASLGTAAKEVDESVQQAAYEWAKSSCCKRSLNDRERIVRTCHHALTSVPKRVCRRVFLVCTSRIGETSTTVVEILLDQPTGEHCWCILETRDQFKMGKAVAVEAVVLAWFADERGMAVLPVRGSTTMHTPL